MGLLDNVRERAVKYAIKQLGIDTSPRKATSYGRVGNVYTMSYDGEKNFGEAGPALNLRPNYQILRVRSWQAYLENELSQTILNKYILWIISHGLKIQANPINETLKAYGVNNFNKELFNERMEALFTTWGKSRNSSHNGVDNLNILAQKQLKEVLIGGDVLVVLRVKNGNITVQLIDGAHVQTPTVGTMIFTNYGLYDTGVMLKNGNMCKHGVEVNAAGEHVAYHVKLKDGGSKRILAKSPSTGFLMAYMVYANEFRLDGTRGIPIMSSSLETLKKLDRYKEAVVGSAEERAKIVYTINHNRDSTGEDPRLANMTRSFRAAQGYGDNVDDPIDDNGVQLANTITATTNKQTFNMPIGAELRSLDSTVEISFAEFWEANTDMLCASVGIPPNVAFSKYNDSFSASRAATKDWEHTIVTNRENILFRFYQPIYNLFIHLQILGNKATAPGYINAYTEKNFMVLEAYRNCRITGPMFPHIDPVKEVTAERMKLGKDCDRIPLTTVEQATEVVNGGDSDSNAEQVAAELAAYEKLRPLHLE